MLKFVIVFHPVVIYSEFFKCSRVNYEMFKKIVMKSDIILSEVKKKLKTFVQMAMKDLIRHVSIVFLFKSFGNNTCFQ